MNEMNRVVPRSGVFAIQPADTRFDFLTQGLIVLDSLAGGDAYKNELDVTNALQTGQKNVDRIQAMQDTLCIVHPLHRKDDLFALVSRADFFPALAELG